MGTWGTGIFSDDLAADLQLDWRDLIAGGAGPEAATQQLLKQYADSIKDMDEAPVFLVGPRRGPVEDGSAAAKCSR
jgi:hypothetical protein